MITLEPGTSVGTGRRPLVVVGLVLLAGMVFLGSWFLITHVLARETLTVDAQAPGAGASALIVDSDSADLTLRPSTDGQVHVHATGHYSGGQPLVTATAAEGAVKVEARCAREWLAWCSLTVEVQAPPDVAVTLHDDNGDVDLAGYTGTLTLTSDNGDITVADPQSAVSAISDNGRISITGSTAARITAQTDNGDIDVVSTVAPNSLDARSNNGNLDIRVPDRVKYVVDASSDNGTVTVTVGVDTDSVHTITAITDNGDVDVRPLG